MATREYGKKIPVFSMDKGGVLLNPEVVARCLICSYAADGGTWGKQDGCGSSWCDPSFGARDPWCGGQAIRANRTHHTY